jgi:hypothetical protein
MSAAGSASHADELPDDAILWRRVQPTQVKRSGTGLTPQSGVFRGGNADMSLHVAANANRKKILEDYPGYGIVAVTAGQLRAVAGLTVFRSPEPHDASHALAQGKVTVGQARQLARESTWVVRPAQNQLGPSVGLRGSPPFHYSGLRPKLVPPCDAPIVRKTGRASERWTFGARLRESP